MKIRELTTSFRMSITVSNGQSQMTFPSNIAFVSGDKLYVEPFMYNGSILSFNSANISISMIAFEDEKSPFLWKGVTVEKEVVDEKTYHVIKSGLRGIKINRRDNFRVYIGIKGKVTLNEGNEEIEVIVKDISETGFAVLVDPKNSEKINTNDALQVYFYDAAQEEHMTLSGRIVRCAVSGKYYLFGCRTLQDGGMSRKYIANKQLERRINSMKKQ